MMVCWSQAEFCLCCWAPWFSWLMLRPLLWEEEQALRDTQSSWPATSVRAGHPQYFDAFPSQLVNSRCQNPFGELQYHAVVAHLVQGTNKTCRRDGQDEFLNYSPVAATAHQGFFFRSLFESHFKAITHSVVFKH